MRGSKLKRLTRPGLFSLPPSSCLRPFPDTQASQLCSCLQPLRGRATLSRLPDHGPLPAPSALSEGPRVPCIHQRHLHHSSVRVPVSVCVTGLPPPPRSLGSFLSTCPGSCVHLSSSLCHPQL